MYLYFIWFQKVCLVEITLRWGSESFDVKNANQPTKLALHHSIKRGILLLAYISLTDGLVDCMDPDCCLQSSCQNQPYCRGLPDPQDIISQSLQSPSQQAAKSFYDRISFLIGSDSTHVIPGESPFNKRLVRLFLLYICSDIINSYMHFM